MSHNDHLIVNYKAPSVIENWNHKAPVSGPRRVNVRTTLLISMSFTLNVEKFCTFAKLSTHLSDNNSIIISAELKLFMYGAI